MNTRTTQIPTQLTSSYHTPIRQPPRGLSGSHHSEVIQIARRRTMSTKPSIFSVLKSIVLPSTKKAKRTPSSTQPQQFQSQQEQPESTKVSRQQQIYDDFLQRRGQKAGIEMESFEAMWSFLNSSLHHPHKSHLNNDQYDNNNNNNNNKNNNNMMNYTMIEPDDHWSWAYNTHSGLHPAFPFLTPTQTIGAQTSHFYSYPAPTTPVYVTGISKEDILPHEKLVAIKGVDFLPNTTVYNRHLYHGGSISYYNRLDLDQAVWWKILPSRDVEHRFAQSKKNLIDHQLALSEEHLSKVTYLSQKQNKGLKGNTSNQSALNKVDNEFDNNNDDDDDENDSQHINIQSNPTFHSDPISVLKMYHLLYPFNKQDKIININPVPTVNQFIISSEGLGDDGIDDHNPQQQQQQQQQSLNNRQRHEIPELQKDRHDVHIGYKVTGETIDHWSRLNGNTNKLTLDQEYSQAEGFPGRIIPIQLLSTLALDGLHAVSKIIAPPKPVIFDAMEELIVETRFEGFKQGFLEHLQHEASQNGDVIPEELTLEQLEWVTSEFYKGNNGEIGQDGSEEEEEEREEEYSDDVTKRVMNRKKSDHSNIPWHSTVQSLRSFVFESTRPIYLPVMNNMGQVDFEQGFDPHGYKSSQPTVYLDFYAQISRDDLNHDHYSDAINLKMNDAMDYVDQLQQEYNPIDPDQLSLAEIDSIPLKRLSILRSDVDGKVHQPDKFLTRKDSKNDRDRDGDDDDDEEEMDAKISSFFSTTTIEDDQKIKKAKNKAKENKDEILSRYQPNHQWDLVNRIYLESDEPLERLIKYNDLLRDKPAFVKVWFTVRYDNPLINTGNDMMNRQSQDQSSMVESLEKCFLGFATFGTPLTIPSSPSTQHTPQRGYNLLTLEETNDTLAFVQGIEIIQDDGVYH